MRIFSIAVFVLLTLTSSAVAQDCVHPFLVREKDGSTWIDCVATSKALDRLNTLTSIWLGAANGLDTGSTLGNLIHGRHVREGNPALAPLLDNGHYAAFAVLKAGETAALIEYFDRFYHQHPKAAVILKASVASVYTAVGVHNLSLR